MGLEYVLVFLGNFGEFLEVAKGGLGYTKLGARSNLDVTGWDLRVTMLWSMPGVVDRRGVVYLWCMWTRCRGKRRGSGAAQAGSPVRREDQSSSPERATPGEPSHRRGKGVVRGVEEGEVDSEGGVVCGGRPAESPWLAGVARRHGGERDRIVRGCGV